MTSLWNKLGFGSQKSQKQTLDSQLSPSKEDKKHIIDVKEEETDNILAPKGHQKYKEQDKEKCPFYQIQKGQNNNTTQSPGSTQGSEGPQSQDEIPKQKKEKVPKGGCPFMPSEKQKNPSLEPCTEAWNQQFISVFAYLLDYTGFFSLLKNTKRPSKDRVVFDQYPIYLKHTLFFNDETMQKVRNLQVAQRFFAYDQLKEQGNKHYNRGQYETALQYFERAFGVFQWLDYIQEKDSDEEEQELQALPREDLDQTEQNQNQGEDAALNPESEKEGVINRQKREMQKKVQEQEKQLKETKEEFVEDKKKQQYNNDQERKKDEIDLDEEEQERQIEEETLKQMKKQDKQMRKQYKSLMITYNDKNVFLRDGQDLTDAHDIDLRNSMLLNIYMNLACTYMKLFHFKLAEQALADALQITDKNSQILFRRSQAVSYNKWVSIKELEQAQDDIEKAIGMKRFEKIFNSEPGILKILNLENHEEIYLGQAHYVVKRIQQRREFESERIKEMLQREKQIEEIEAEMIAEGKTPCEGYEVELQGEEPMEREVSHEMLAQYYRIIEFYQETKKPDQVKIAQKELQILSETIGEMEFFFQLDFQNADENPVIKEVNSTINVDFSNPKILRRLKRIQQERAKEVFEQGQFNFEVFEYALKDYFRKKEEREKRKQKKENQEEQSPEVSSKARRLVSKIFSKDFMMQIFLLIAFIGVVFYFGRNNSTVKNLIFANQSK